MRKRLILCSVLVAVVGLSSALLIYLTAGEDDLDENVQTVLVDGKTFRIPLASTKMYRRDLRRFGGDAAVLFDDLDSWFRGLWRGRSLGVTLAWMTAFVSLGLFLLARQMPSDDRGDDQDPG